MYSSGYSQVSKHSPQATKTMQYRSNSKSCGYYMRIVFFFSSLIQSLIIVSLVLFLVYGKTQDSACKERNQDLEERFSQLSLDNVALKKQRTNLTTFLNATLTEKARIDFDLRTLRHQTNISILYFHDYEMKLHQFNTDLISCRLLRSSPCPTTHILNSCNCGLLAEQLKARFQLVNSNFTQSVQTMKMEMEEIAKERDNLNLETIKLRRDITTKEKQLQIFEKTSKDEFSQSLGSVYNVSRAFLHKIESIFPAHIAFQLTCPKQREHLEQIRSNCTNLSREVEDKLQHYMNTVGNHVSGIQNENIRLKAENWRFSEDYRSCSQERTGMVEQHKQNLDKLQQKHDQDQERLLKEKKKLSGEKEVLESTVNYKTKQIDSLMQQIQQLNKSRSGLGYMGLQPATPVQNRWGPLGGVGSNSPSSGSTGFGQQGKTGSVGVLGPGSSSLGSSFNKPASTLLGATGASSSNSPLSTGSRVSSPGLGLNKPGSTLTGGAFPSLGSAESNPNLSSGGIGSNNPLLSGRGSSSIGSSSGSSVLTPNLSSNGLSLNKQTSSTRSSGFGLGSSSSSSSSSPSSSSSSSSSSSPSSTNKNAFGFSWFGSSNSGQSKTPSVPGRGTSSGTSTGAGSPFGAGKPNGMTGNVAQHIQNLQRLINPPGPQEKQDLSRMLG